MATESGTEKKLSLKIMVDIKANKVVFAEAGKEFVDFIFHIMSLPLASISKLLNEQGIAGNVGALFRSIDGLDSDCFEPNLNKDSILRPKHAVSVPLLTFHDVPIALKVYKCDNYNKYQTCKYVTDCNNTTCPTCRATMMQIAGSYVTPPGLKNTSAKYVRGGATFMVTDNMEVKPMSISLVMSLVKDFDFLQEREVQLGRNEGLALVKAVLENQDVLTSVFLQKKKKSKASTT